MNPLRGLYAITPEALCAEPERLESAAAAALRGGARLLQLRDKTGDSARRRGTAARLLALCHRMGARFIVNDDLDLAEAIGADGVHLGASDAPLQDARRRLGAAAFIGISCANNVERALSAQAQGASYVAFGRFFPSNTKPRAPQAGVALLRQARPLLRIPICAIGGVTPANAPELIKAGADMVAAVEGVFGAADDVAVEAAASAYSHLFAER